MRHIESCKSQLFDSQTEIAELKRKPAIESSDLASALWHVRVLRKVDWVSKDVISQIESQEAKFETN
jgi:hypothetical protein